ncbi:MAG TPA: TonB family protein [Pyrinomonadaceae bacterium]
MKTCPSCHRVYEDDTQVFCLEDGTPLVSEPAASHDPGATIKIPASRLTDQDQAETLISDAPVPPPRTSPPLPPTQKYEAPIQPVQHERKSSALPWILGAAAILGLSAIAVAWIVTRQNGPETAQTTQNISQAESGNTSENMNTAPELNNNSAGDNSAVNPAASPTMTSAATPAPVTTSNIQVSRIPEQPASTPRATPASTPGVRSDEPPPPPQPTPVPKPRAPISGGVLNGKAVSLPKPPYPAIAKAAHASGTVTVQVTIDELGRVISARAVSGHPLLQQAAVQAAYGARFTPTQLSGQPVKVTGVILYNFVAQ